VRALLLIADIGGYTRFMSVHRINLSHAQTVVARLLEAVIDAAKPLKLAKLEGDAAFFFQKLPDTPRPAELAAVGRLVTEMREAFLRTRSELDINRVCTCDGCVQAGQLTLKFVAHQGEVVLQKVKRHTELAGVDVIFVHRLLKNSVPIREYALVSEPVFEHLDEALKAQAHAQQETLEGLGEVTTRYVDLTQVTVPPPAAQPSRLRAWLHWVRLTWRSLPYFLGLKQPCRGFANLGEVLPRQQLPPG
jgi:class 3 adenylate cyclase